MTLAILLILSGVSHGVIAVLGVHGAVHNMVCRDKEAQIGLALAAVFACLSVACLVTAGQVWT